MVAKRPRAWKHPDTGAAKLPKVVDARVSYDTPHSTFGKILAKLQLLRVRRTQILNSYYLAIAYR